MILFKVLVDGKPCSGGTGEYPASGIWTPDTTPICCASGWHLTANPLKWFKEGCDVWTAEGRGLFAGDGTDKMAFQSVRLIEKIGWDWKYLSVFPAIRLMLAVNSKDWARADLSGANLYGANLSRADLSGANLSGANLYGADLSGANLYGADLSGADLYGANLSRADLSGADLSGANLSGANLYGANLYGADLSGADLYGANLYGADLSGADLYGANLYGADLSGADLSGADLYGANLSRANLYGADLSGAIRPTNAPDGWKADDTGVLIRA